MAHRHYPASVDNGESGAGLRPGCEWTGLTTLTWPYSLLQAGAHVRDDAVANLTQLIGGARELHAYSVRRLYSALAQDISQVMFPPPRLRVTQPSQSFLGPLLLTPGSQQFSLKVTTIYLVEETLKDRALFLVRTRGLLILVPTGCITR